MVTGWLNRLRHFLTTEAPARLKDMVDTTRALVTTTLVKAGEMGLGVEESARLLRQKVAELTPGRAVVIAQTELLAGSNYGSLLGAEATGLPLLKVWLSTKDDRTRPSHVVANGQAVAMDGLFNVGGYAAKYPGDPMLPGAECIRCRCAITYKPKE